MRLSCGLRAATRRDMGGIVCDATNGTRAAPGPKPPGTHIRGSGPHCAGQTPRCAGLTPRCAGARIRLNQAVSSVAPTLEAFKEHGLRRRAAGAADAVRTRYSAWLKALRCVAHVGVRPAHRGVRPAQCGPDPDVCEPRPANAPVSRTGSGLLRALRSRGRCGCREQHEEPDQPARAAFLRASLAILFARTAAALELLDQLAFELGIVGSFLPAGTPARTPAWRRHTHTRQGSPCACGRPVSRPAPTPYAGSVVDETAQAEPPGLALLAELRPSLLERCSLSAHEVLAPGGDSVLARARGMRAGTGGAGALAARSAPRAVLLARARARGGRLRSRRG